MPSFGIAATGTHQPDPFRRLDRFINNPGNRPAFVAGLVAGQKQGFGPGGPFANDQAMQSHWSADWINAQGRGGRYWPYLDNIDIAQELAAALAQSIAAVDASPGKHKVHNTTWETLGDPPADPGTLTAEQKRTLFKVSVTENEERVELLIRTPKPVQ
jgi:hypothetical protein